MYEKTLDAGWGDMDFKSHMRDRAYLDRSADIRMMFFSESGFPKEVGLLQELRVTLAIASLVANPR